MLKKHLSIQRSFLLFQLLRQGVVLLIAILLTKTSLSIAAIGAYEQLWFLGNALSFFWMVGLQQGMIQLYPRIDIPQRRRLLTLATITFGLFSALIVGLLAALPDRFFPFFNGTMPLPVGHLGLWFLCFYLPTLLTDTLHLLLERPLELLGYGLVSFGLQLLVVLGPAWLDWGLPAILQGLLAWSILRLLWLLVLVWRFGQAGFDRPLLQQWRDASAYLMLYAAIGAGIAVGNGWIVHWYYQGDALQFALYRYGARELPLALALVGGINAVALQQAAKEVKTALPFLKRQSTQLMHLLFPLSAVLLVTAPWWFTRVFSADFSASLPVFTTFLLLNTSRVILSFTLVNVLQEKALALRTALIELLISMSLSWVLLPYWGLVGVALANVLAYGLEKGIYCWVLYRKHHLSPSTYLNVHLWLAYVIGLIFLWVLQFIWVQ